MHVCIIGAGLAGACAAGALLPHARISLLERAAPGAGASGVAAGLANPFMGQKARPLDRYAERLRALEDVLHAARLPPMARGVVRPATDAAQAALFEARAARHPGALAWHPPSDARSAWPLLHAPWGALLVADGCAVDVGGLVGALVGRVHGEGAAVCTGEAGAVDAVELHASGVRVHARQPGSLDADVVVVCAGGASHALLPALPPHAALPLHRVKGQLIRLHAPDVARRLPPVAGHGYLVPDGDAVVVGSTFEHAFEHLDPTPEGIARLRETAAALVPALRDAPLLDARAGVRVTVPGRQPLLAPLDARARLWVFNGLGARGLLTAPWLAGQLWNYLEAPATLPPALRGPR